MRVISSSNGIILKMYYMLAEIPFSDKKPNAEYQKLNYQLKNNN
jgi:hypothetical protein